MIKLECRFVHTCIYVPEVHPLTCNEYHEKEDDAHVLKVIYRRFGHNNDIELPIPLVMVDRLPKGLLRLWKTLNLY